MALFVGLRLGIQIPESDKQYKTRMFQLVIYVIFEAFWKKSEKNGVALIGLLVGFLLRESGFFFCTALIGLFVGFLLGVVGLSRLMSVT